MNNTLYSRFVSLFALILPLIGLSALSSVASAQSPAAATNVTVQPVGPRKIQVAWTDNANDETGYVVERSASPGGPSWTASAMLPVDSVFYEDSQGLQGNTIYYYRVKSVNGAGESYSAETSGTTAPYPSANRNPDALGILPDGVGVYYSNSTSDAITSFEGIDNDASKDGEFAASSAGAFWFKRHTPDSPTGALPLDEVDVYWKDGNGDWVYQSTLEPPLSAGSTSGFGTSVVASGAKIYVGAPGALNGSSVASGVVYEYALNGATLSLVNTIEPPSGVAGDQFGFSLAVDGARLLVGATGRDQSTPYVMTDAGAVFFYEFDTSWTLVYTAWSQAGHDNGRFGFSVALNGRVLAIGAPFEQGWITVGNTTYVMGEVGTVHVGRWDRPAELLGFYNLFSLFAPVQAEVEGLSSSHFGWSVAVDDMMRVAVSMPDNSWQPADNMTGWDSGLVMLLNWNGSIDNYSFNVNAFSHSSMVAGDRFGEYLETADGSVDFGVGTALREADNSPVHYFAVAALQVQPGVLGVPFRVGDVVGMDEDDDPLGFTIPTFGNPNGSHFAITSGGELQALDSLQWVINGLQPLTLNVEDDRGGLSTRTFTLDLSGAAEDTDSDGLPDWWEVAHFSDLSQNGMADGDGDGLIDLQEYGAGTDPLDSDSDNDGIADGAELTAGTDPNDPDTDADGIPDGVEITYGLDPNNVSDAQEDLDGDGFSNLTAHQRNWPLNAALTNIDDLDGDRINDVIEAHWVEVYPLMDSGEGPAPGFNPLDDPDLDNILTFEELEYSLNPAFAETVEGISDWETFDQLFTVAYGNAPPQGGIGDVDTDGLPDHWEYLYEFNLRNVLTPTLDPDSDGLNNAQEFALGSNPILSDSDGDGLPDSWEVTNGLDLNDATDVDMDADGDGVTNGDEYTNNTNPQSSADSNSNGVPDDWETANAGRLAITPAALNATVERGDTSTVAIKLSNGTNQPVSYTIALSNNGLEDYLVNDSITGSATYGWEDISTTGTKLNTISDADDNTEGVSLGGFAFPFYGTSYHMVNVSSNGAITFQIPSSSYSNTSLPSTSAPAPLIALLWDDLNPGSQGDIYFKEYTNYAIIQYQAVRQHSSSEVYTFQILLHSNGRIEMRYHTITGSANSCTVGIQGPGGTYGKQVAYNSSYLQSGMAVIFEPDPGSVISGTEFFTVTPLAGSAGSVSIASLTGMFDSHSLASGTYNATMEVTTSDTQTPTLSVPVTLTVIDPPTTVQIVSPADDTEFAQWDSIEILAEAANSDYPIDTVEFFSNGVKLGNGFSQGDDLYSYSWYAPVTGTHQITVRASVNGVSTGVSSPIEIVVSPDSDYDGMPNHWETTYGLNPSDNSDAILDDDGDGISNRHEFELGFKPNSTDSDNDSIIDAQEDRDNDGLFDWWELVHFGNSSIAKPLDDPDSDTLTNLQEQAAGSNPQAYDSDNDGLPDAWEIANGLDPQNPSDGANVDSDGDGLNNLQEYELGLDPFDTDTDDNGIPDGMQDSDSDGLPDWWEHAYFGSAIGGDATQDDDNDSLTNLQEFTAGTHPYYQDTDGDSLPDGWELANGFNPLASTDGGTTDSDNDGLTNYQEFRLGFNPHHSDSDNDSIPDAQEDADTDGLFDWWELEYFYSVTAAVPGDDSDSDGLTNLQEFTAATNPSYSDSDYDGLPDGWELANGLDPLDPNDGYYEDPDGDGLNNSEELALGFDPMDADSDSDGTLDSQEDRDSDGLFDIWELRNYGDPINAVASADGDGDGLSNLGEQQANTSPFNEDSDGDRIPDGWEVTNGLNPNDDTDANTDSDNDGLGNQVEYALGYNPNSTDSDNDGQDDSEEDSDADGLPDYWEMRYFGSAVAAPANGDADNDGLSNLEEFQADLEPTSIDTDGDLLEDGWEVQYGFDPKDPTGDNGKDGDPDGDGLSNLDEVIHQTDPTDADSDDGGSSDGTEVDNGTNPASGGGDDDNDTPDVIEVPFSVGDPSGSHSERWRMEIKGKVNDDRKFDFESENFGEVDTKKFKLRRNATYEITLKHKDTSKEHLEANDNKPDYDWEARINELPAGLSEDGENDFFVIEVEQTEGTGGNPIKAVWIAANEDGLLTTERHGDDDNITTGKKATIIPLIVEELAPKLVDADLQQIANSEKPVLLPKANGMVEVDPQNNRIAHREIKVKTGPELQGKKLTWSMTPQYIPAAQTEPVFKGSWQSAATAHRDRFATSAVYGAFGFERVSQEEGSTTFDQAGYAAIRANVPPYGLNRARISVRIEDDDTKVELLDLEVPPVIIIDPGHGGHDSGAYSVSGNMTEAEVVRDVSVRMRPHLQTGLANISDFSKLYLTRTTNVYVDIAARQTAGRQRGADIFASVHCNSTKNAGTRRVETNVQWGDQGNYDFNRDQALGSSLNSAVLGALRAFDSSTPDGGVVRNNRYQQGPGVCRDSPTANGNNRDTQPIHHPMLSALVELEFITNVAADALLISGKTATPQDPRNWNSADVRERVAKDLATAILNNLQSQ